MSLVQVKDLGKAYKRYRFESLRILESLAPGFCGHQKRWVFRHVNFQLAKGESIGVVGPNGAGKSTLLKVIAGVSPATEGSVATQGRVASLLELGTGFHGELSGRQNCFLAGGLLGMSTHEVEETLDDILAFSELRDHFDEPLRTYSTGMQMRLGFAVATARRPDVLIVDEALSVGDIYFQQKCLDRIKTYRADGTALLLVSHDPNTLRAFCDACLLLGETTMIGPTKEIIDVYEAATLERQTHAAPQTSVPEIISKPQIGAVSLSLEEAGHEASTFLYGAQVHIRCTIEILDDLQQPVVGLIIRDALGRDVFSFNTFDYWGRTGLPGKGRHEIRCAFRNRLVEGLYFISVSVADGPDGAGNFERILLLRHEAAHFYSAPVGPGVKFRGVADLCPTDLEWRPADFPT